MKPILILLPFMAFSSAHALPPITITQVDSLKLPFTLEQLTERLEEQFKDVDRPLLIQRKWETIIAFYQFQKNRMELSLLEKVRDNIKAVHQLNYKRQLNAEITDLEYFSSKNRLLQQEVEVLNTREQARTNLLRICQLANLEIISDEQEKAPAEAP